MILAQNVGCDLSKKDFKVNLSVMNDQREIKIRASHTFKNNLKGFEAFIKWVEQKRIKGLEITFTLEATGVYYESLTYYLHSKGYEVSVQLPTKTKAYAKSLNEKSKTDKIDARTLARMGLERKLKAWNPVSPQMRNLKKLCRQRIRLIELKTMISNQIHAESQSYQPQKEVLKSLRTTLRQIEKQIEKMEALIEKLFQKDEILYAHRKQICKINGIGLITLATILAETNGFLIFTSRSQLVSYAGYDVVYNQSGDVNRKTRISKKGNKYIRRALHFPALTAVRYDKNFRDLYERIFERRKIKMVAYVAVQRKLLTTIYSLFKKNQAYDPNYQNNKHQQLKEAV